MNMPGLNEKVALAWPAVKWRDFTVLLGVSGGADSVCLLRAVHSLKTAVGGSGRLVIAHVNHRLRGAESDGDAEFVGRLADQLQIPLEIETTDNSESDPSNRGLGLEARLRQARYRIFEALAEKHGARYLLTGHTRDDQIETVLFRIMRGTGVEGLAGIPFTRRINESLTVVRPLLNISRVEVLDDLKSLGQDFRVDSSNLSGQFARNRIRNKLLPVMQECVGNPVEDSIIKLAEHARRHSQLIEQLIMPVLKEHFSIRPLSIEVAAEGLDQYPNELLKSAVRHAWRSAGLATRDMSVARWEALTRHLTAPADPDREVVATFPGNVRLVRSGDAIRLSGSPSSDGNGS